MATSAEEEKKRYKTLNEQVTGAADYKSAMREQVNKQTEYRQNNPTSTSYIKDDERSAYDADAYTGKERTAIQGTSSADESFMSDKDYSYLQQLKSNYADAQSKYNAAVAAGQDGSQYQEAMNQAHLDAERLRSGYGYSGGADGSMYITDAWFDDGSNKTAGGGVSGAPSSPNLSGRVTDYSTYLSDMYEAKKAAKLAALKSAYEQNIAAIDRAGEGLEESYQSARNQTAGASELAAREFAEYAAAAGLNNGTAGQGELARGVTLQNNMNTLNTQEAQTVADLRLQRSNAEIEYNNAIAQAEAEGNYELANALYQEKVRVQNALINAEIQQYQQEYQAYRDSVGDSQWQQSFDQSVAQQQWQNDLTMQQYQNTLAQQQLQNALTAQKYQDSQTQAQKETLASYGQAFLQSGVMPSDEMLAAMGITSADAQAFINATATQQEAESSSMTLSAAKEMAEYGVFTEESLAVLTQNGFTEDYLSAKYGYKPANSEVYKAVVDDLMAMINGGANMTEIRAALRGALNEGILTRSEYEQLCAAYTPGMRT